jgi:hypothetical protein
MCFKSLKIKFLTGLMLLAANPLSACPVCFSAKKNTLAAYYGTTLLLTALPFIVIGTGIWLIRRHLQRKY